MQRTQGRQGPGVKGAGVGLEGVSAWLATGLRALWEQSVVSSFPPHPQPGFGFQVFNPLPSTSQCLSWSKQRPPHKALAPGQCLGLWVTVNWALHPGSVGSLYRVSL